MPAILFGSISTVADTSELQRQSYNEAFAAHGLDWSWERDDYVAMLEKSGGQDRVQEYAAARGEDVDAAEVHRTKSEIFQQKVTTDGVSPRPGVVETVAAAHRDGVKLALVTTTSPDNIASLARALRPTLDLATFDLVVDSSQVEQPKPDQAAYAYALTRLEESAGSCVAIEDNVGGVASATAAGLPCVAFPNQNTEAHSFDQATARVSELDFTELRGLAAGA